MISFIVSICFSNRFFYLGRRGIIQCLFSGTELFRLYLYGSNIAKYSEKLKIDRGKTAHSWKLVLICLAAIFFSLIIKTLRSYTLLIRVIKYTPWIKFWENFHHFRQHKHFRKIHYFDNIKKKYFWLNRQTFFAIIYYVLEDLMFVF